MLSNKIILKRNLYIVHQRSTTPRPEFIKSWLLGSMQTAVILPSGFYMNRIEMFNFFMSGHSMPPIFSTLKWTL